MILIQYSLM